MTKPFLKETIRKELVKELVELDVDEDGAIRLANAGDSDNLVDVDLAMTAHVILVEHFRQQHVEKGALIGMACLTAFMEEARSRGLGETDFPISLDHIKAAVMNKGNNTTLQ